MIYEKELDIMLDAVQEYAEINLIKTFEEDAKELASIFEVHGVKFRDRRFNESVRDEAKLVITTSMLRLANEYADYQDANYEYVGAFEELIVEMLDTKYSSHLKSQFVQHGIPYTDTMISNLITEMILELPFAYANAFCDNEKGYEMFLSEVLHAYHEKLEYSEK
ncbi:hypothetical protein Goe5_c00620 [Bacillus phage vB_BthM-Goe5]|nr:hypothetical protein Goe5_c00620 [Bacillus phage vB_BthM-Goe5]